MLILKRKNKALFYCYYTSENQHNIKYFNKIKLEKRLFHKRFRLKKYLLIKFFHICIHTI